MRCVWIALVLVSSVVHAEVVSFDSERWVIEAAEHRFEEYEGRSALWLKGGRAVLPDLDMKTGVMEFDIAFSPARGFSGAMFHVRDGRNFEQFYLRPHQSGNPDATQYQPVITGHTAWQIYYGEEYAAPIEHRFDTWQHVRIEFLEDRAAVYVDSGAPVLIIDSLDRHDPGGAIGVQSGFAPAYFSNFSYSSAAGVTIPQREVVEREGSDREIQRWSVSSAFDEELAQVLSLGEFEGGTLSWKDVNVEPKGIVNIARAVEARKPNTVFARVIIDAAVASKRVLELGYSDRARVFLNGELLYAGQQNYVSQDYRFLGTMGLYDSLLLNLKAGENELRVAVSEDFGGWGIMGRFDSMADIRVRSSE